MFINTHSRFNRLYQQHQATIDPLLLVTKLLAIAIALMFLLSVLGWAAAISYATAWCDRLVESSLGSANPTTSSLQNNLISPPVATECIAEPIQDEGLLQTEVSESSAPVTSVTNSLPEASLDLKPATNFKSPKKQATRSKMALQSILN